ncbi:MAG: hypothetical protein GTN40_05360 [Candidatus Aenigmarchaeota archaeon]|nr:hypothetical protein [Candidatus Aenigmarchaeota archaeon]
MWEFKVIDILNYNRNKLHGVFDFDGTLVNPKYKNLSVANIDYLDRSGKYGRYKCLLREVLNSLEKTGIGYRNTIEEITQNLCDFAVRTFDWHSATLKVVKETELDKPTKNFLKILQKVPAAKFKIFTGGEESAAKLYVKNKIAQHIPNVEIEVHGTVLGTDGRGYFTGDIIEPLWDAEERANETREFIFNKFDKLSCGAGDKKLTDLPFLRYPTASYLLRGPATAYQIGRVEGNVKYIDRKDLAKEFKKFLNTDAREVPLPITNLNVVTPLVRRG